MKGKLFKKVIASVSAVSMLASMAFAIPASAAVVQTDVLAKETFDNYTAPANTEVIADPSDSSNKVLKISKGANVTFADAYKGEGTIYMTMDVNYATKVTGSADKNYSGLYFAFAESSKNLGSVMKVYGSSTDTTVPVGFVFGGGGGQFAKAGDATINQWYTVLITVNKDDSTVSYVYYDKKDFAEKGTEAEAKITRAPMGYRNGQVPNSLIISMDALDGEFIYIDNLRSYTETDPDAKNELKDFSFKTTPGATITPPPGDKEEQKFPVELALEGTKVGEEFTETMCDSITWTHKGSETDDGYIGWEFTNGKASGNISITNGVSSYYCILTATVTAGEKTISKDYKFVINPPAAVPGQIYPVGFPTDWNQYPESLVGYQLVNGALATDPDPLIGHWASVGSNGSRTLILKKDDTTGNKYLELDSHGGGGSTTSGVSIGAQAGQMIFEFEAKMVNGASFVYANNTPNNSARNYQSAFDISVEGDHINTGTTRSNAENTAAVYTGGQSITGVTADEWYKIVASYDKSIQQYYVKVYTLSGELVGSTEMQASNDDAAPSVFSMNGSPAAIRNLRVYTPVVSGMTIQTANDSIRVPEEAGKTESLDLSAVMTTADGLEATGAVSWAFENGEVANATLESTGAQTAKLTVSPGAASGDVVVVATKDSAQAKKTIKFITSANNVAFTESTSSMTIPFDGEPDAVATFKAETRTGEGVPVGGTDTITYRLLDSTGTKDAAVKGVSFENGVLTVKAGAAPAVVFVQATNSEGLTNRVRVNIHGMTFAFGTEEPEEGYTPVLASTVYNDNTGYGFESATGLEDVAGAEGTPSSVKGTSAYKMNVKVPNGNYTVTLSTTSGAVLSEAVSGSATGISKSAGSAFNVAVCDGILDLTFDANSSVSTLQISQMAAKVPGTKPAIYSIGDSTTKNSGHYSGYDASTATDHREYASWGNCVTSEMYSDTFSAYNNHGMAGRNSANYYCQARLEAVLLAVAPGDYVTINMGINSESNEPYETLIEKYYIDGVLQRGGIPVILTHTPDGVGYNNSQSSYDPATQTFTVNRADNGRVKFLKQIAADKGLYLIDVGTHFQDYFNSLKDKNFETEVLPLANTVNVEKGTATAPTNVYEVVRTWFPDHNHYTKELGTMIAEYVIGELTKIAKGEVEPPAKTYTVTFTGANASVSVNGAVVTSTTVDEGGKVEFTVAVDNGYKLVSVKAGDNELTAENGVYTLSDVNADTTVTITTEADDNPPPATTHTVTFDAEVVDVNSELDISVTSIIVDDGGSVSFRVVPIPGSNLKEVSADGNNLTLEGDDIYGVYTISDIAADVNVTTKWEPVLAPDTWIKYNVTYDENGVVTEVKIDHDVEPQIVTDNTDTHKVFYWNPYMRPWAPEAPTE